MPKPSRVCSAPGCPELVASGRCAQHSRQVEQQRPNVDVRRLYYRVGWQSRRQIAMAKNPFCPECLVEGGRYVPTTDVDHIVPHRGDLRLFWLQSNLQALCHAHHSRKTGRGE